MTSDPISLMPLVNEAFVRLASEKARPFANRTHFLAIAALDAEQARIVELRYFGGLTLEETAEAIGISPATVKRQWAMARAWLKRAIDCASDDAVDGEP